jgi:hypothetical protein
MSVNVTYSCTIQSCHNTLSCTVAMQLAITDFALHGADLTLSIDKSLSLSSDLLSFLLLVARIGSIVSGSPQHPVRTSWTHAGLAS